MFDPALALLLFAVFTVLVMLALWPKRGVYARLSRMADMSERVLLEDHVVAGNVTVGLLPETESADEPVSTLLHVNPGASAKVVGISQACQGSQRRRLLDLGVVPGTTVDVVFESAAGDPAAYNIRGALIALRREQADWIQVEFDRNASSEEAL
tara:strand:+ start:6076 stop:6537 length:462 start_codon:yes stop_codon:yes gene_type:complete